MILMVRLFLGILFFNFLVHISIGQILRAQVGYGRFNSSMEDLRSFQDSRLNSIDNPAKLIEDFPGNYYYEVQLKYGLKEKRQYIGLLFSSSRTGSRIISEYPSSILKLDARVKSILLGIMCSVDFPLSPRLAINANLTAPMILSAVFFTNRLISNGQELVEEELLFSESYGVIPGLEIDYSLKRFYCGIRGCFMLDIKAPLYRAENNNVHLVHQGEKVKTDWTGIRGNIFIGYSIDFSNRKSKVLD